MELKHSMDVDTMDIYSKPGTKVYFHGMHGYDVEKQSAAKIFRIGQVLTVNRTEVSSSSTSVYFEETGNRAFNSVLFGPTTDNEKIVYQVELVDVVSGHRKSIRGIYDCDTSNVAMGFVDDGMKICHQGFTVIDDETYYALNLNLHPVSVIDSRYLN